MGITNKVTEIIGKVIEVFIGEDIAVSSVEEMERHTLLYTY